MSFTILGAIKWWARERPDAVALDVDGAAITYGDFDRWARAIAARLAELGIGREDRVALLGDQSLPYFAIAYALQYIGGIAVPINTRFTARELAVALEETTPRLLLADTPYLDLGREGVGLRPDVSLTPMRDAEGWRDAPSEPFPFEATRDSLIALMSTSGSTARPKFVRFTHDMVVSVALEVQLIEPAIRHGRAMLVAPPFSGGLYTTFEYLVLGCTCFLQSRFDPQVAIDLIEHERITVMPASTVFLERIAALPRFPDADLSSVVWATVGGARVPPELVKLYRKKGIMVRCLFGQTEAGAAWAATGSALADPMQAGFGGPFSEWRVERDGQPLPAGEIGEIAIRSPTMMAGYWNNAEASGQALRGGWLHTGDLGVMNEEGSLTFIDRMKDIIISGGLNISAAEVEHVIAQIEGVEEVAVIAAADKRFGETPMAVVYGDRRIDPRHIVQHCNMALADYKVPRYISVEGEPLPRLASGKISKPILRERYKDAADTLPRVR